MYTNGPVGLWKAGSHLQKKNLPGFLQRPFKLLLYCRTCHLPFSETEEIFSNREVRQIDVNALLVLVLPFLQNNLYYMKSNGVFGSEVFYSPGTGCWILDIHSEIGVHTSLHCTQVCYRHMSLNHSCSNNVSVSTCSFLPWSRSSVIILLVWFQVLSINIIFFSLVPSLLLLEMHSFGIFSSSGSIFACLRSGSLEQSSSLEQTPFLVYFWRWKAISFTETELGPGNTSAIWMKKTKRSECQ